MKIRKKMLFRLLIGVANSVGYAIQYDPLGDPYEFYLTNSRDASVEELRRRVANLEGQVKGLEGVIKRVAEVRGA